jgi:hypothetical protein
MMAGDWFYVSGESELGPFSTEQVQDLLTRGEITPDTMLRKKSWMDWKRAESVDLNAVGQSGQFPVVVADSLPLPDVVLPDVEQEGNQKALVGIAAGLVFIAVAALGIYLVLRQGQNRPTAKPPTGSEVEVVGSHTGPAKSRSSISPAEARESVYEEASPEDQELLDWLDAQLSPGPSSHRLSPEDQELLEWLHSQLGPSPAAFPLSPEDQELLDWLDSQLHPAPRKSA